MLTPEFIQKNVGSDERIMRSTLGSPEYMDFAKANLGDAFERTTTNEGLLHVRASLAEMEEYGDYAPGVQYNPAVMKFGYAPQPQKGRKPDYISQEDWNENNEHFRPGVKWEKNFTPIRAKIYAEEYDKRRERQMVISAGVEEFGFVKGTAASFLLGVVGSLPDPVNLIPFTGGAMSKSIAQGARRGIVEGIAGNALADMVVLPRLSDRGADVGFTDFTLDVIFGGIVGGVLGGFGGFLGKRRQAKLEEKAVNSFENQTTETAQDVFSSFEDTPDSFLRPENIQMPEVLSPFPTVPDSFLDPTVNNHLRQVVDIVRATTGGEDRMTLARAATLAIDDVAAGRAVDVKAIFEGTNTFNEINAKALIVNLETQSFAEIRFGKIRSDYKAALNEIRTHEGQPIIEGDELIVPAGVVKHLYEKRILNDGMSAEQVAELLINVFHRDADFASATRYPHIQALVALRGELADLGLVKRESGSGNPVVHTAYTTEKDSLSKKLSLEKTPWRDAASPHRNGSETPPPAAPRLSDFQGNRSILSVEEKVNPFTVADEVNLTLPETRNAHAKNAYEEMGMDPKTGQTLDEAQARQLMEEGKANPEDVAELAKAEAGEAKVNQLEEQGYSIMSCIMGVIE